MATGKQAGFGQIKLGEEASHELHGKLSNHLKRLNDGLTRRQRKAKHAAEKREPQAAEPDPSTDFRL